MDDTHVESSTKGHINVTGYDCDDDLLQPETDDRSEEQHDNQTEAANPHENTMHLLAEEEMRYRVKESKYRSEFQLVQLEKAREELKHLQDVHEMELAHKCEINRIELQSAKVRYDNLMRK